MYVWKPYANEVRFSVHQLCMITIHRLDKLLGPSSMNLERNWSQCIIESWLMLKGRKPGEVLWCVFDFPRDSTISTHLETEIESSGLTVLKNFGLYHLMAIDRTHSLSEASIMWATAIERQVSDGSNSHDFKEFTHSLFSNEKKSQ